MVMHIYTYLIQAPVIGKLNLVPLLEEESHPILSSALMEGCMQAIDEISSDVSVVCHCMQIQSKLHIYSPCSDQSEVARKYSLLLFCYSLANILAHLVIWQLLLA